MTSADPAAFFSRISQRYKGVDLAALEAVLRPVLTPIDTLDKTIKKLQGQQHYRATFAVRITPENEELMQRGRTGKFVPKSYVEGGPWREIAKGRIIDVDYQTGIVTGEVYTGGSKADLQNALDALTGEDFLEIDQYGAAAKVLSGLVEYYLAKQLRDRGYKVRRMPEDMAKHLGAYYHYDFEVERDGLLKKVEVKSIWGTDTRYARLIHSKTKTYPTSSCRFDTQDIFAVSLFLRTGNIRDFAFASSIPRDVKPYGLPRAPHFPDHVHQNPLCEIGDGTWFESIDEVWALP